MADVRLLELSIKKLLLYMNIFLYELWNYLSQAIYWNNVSNFVWMGQNPPYLEHIQEYPSNNSFFSLLIQDIKHDKNRTSNLVSVVQEKFRLRLWKGAVNRVYSPAVTQFHLFMQTRIVGQFFGRNIRCEEPCWYEIYLLSFSSF